MSRSGGVVAIATERALPGLHPDDHPLVEALEAAGVRTRIVVWDEPFERRDVDAVLLRSVWDYYERPDAFAAWLDGLERDGIRCWNPASLVRWNMDKRYLRDLAAKGVATVPTTWVEREEGASIETVIERVRATGWSEMVAKPAISGGAWRTVRFRRDELPRVADDFRAILSGSTMLVQPFLPEIVDSGELSLLFFGGRYSHAVTKRARRDDFRVQWSHGGSHAPFEPSASVVAQAGAVLAAAPSPGLYARVDGVVREGTFTLMELEQVEPYLYFAEGQGSVDRFVEALPLAPPRARPRRGGAA